MPTTKETLIQTRKNLIAVREEISRSPKPSYSIDGQSVSWTEYMAMLGEQIAGLKMEIDSEDDDDIVEEHTQAFT